MYSVNKKNLAVARLVNRGGDKRLRYLHVSPKGTTAVSPELVARVSLPSNSTGTSTVIYPIENVDAHMDGSGGPFSLRGYKPAVTGPHTLVPQVYKCFPEAQRTTATFTCNGELLKRMLECACEVSSNPNKTVRLRIVDGGAALRVDIYREPGEQEFVGCMKPIEYDGDYIPGEIPTGTPKVEKKPRQTGLVLKASEGRRFRGEDGV